MNKLKVLELFGGIGAPRKALERLGIEHEVVDYVEIDKYAVKSYNAIYDEKFEPQDIMTWDKDLDVDLIFHGSPCQDFSLAGKQAGADMGSETRSSLMWETVRIITKLKPKYVIWENVKNVISKKHRHNFDMYLARLEELGYTNHWQVLNSKDYGIPQNRERVFVVSILGKGPYNFPVGNEENCEVINPLKEKSGKGWHFEQNVYSEDSILRSLKAGGGSGNIPKVLENFKFPPKKELKLRLKDMLETEVDEKYYLSDKMIKCFTRNEKGKFPRGERFKEALKLTNEKNIAATKQGYAIAHDGDGVYINRPHQKRGCVQKDKIQTLKTSVDDIGVVVGTYQYSKSDNFMKGKDRLQLGKETSDTIQTTPKEGIVYSNLRIRKLTPKECWRLMGFDDEDVDKASDVNSNTQLYKQAGNSIVVNVLEAIFKNLLK